MLIIDSRGGRRVRTDHIDGNVLRIVVDEIREIQRDGVDPTRPRQLNDDPLAAPRDAAACGLETVEHVEWGQRRDHLHRGAIVFVAGAEQPGSQGRIGNIHSVPGIRPGVTGSGCSNRVVDIAAEGSCDGFAFLRRDAEGLDKGLGRFWNGVVEGDSFGQGRWRERPREAVRMLLQQRHQSVVEQCHAGPSAVRKHLKGARLDGVREHTKIDAQ